MSLTTWVIILLVACLVWNGWELRREQRHSAALALDIASLEAELEVADRKTRRVENDLRLAEDLRRRAEVDLQQHLDGVSDEGS